MRTFAALLASTALAQHVPRDLANDDPDFTITGEISA